MFGHGIIWGVSSTCATNAPRPPALMHAVPAPPEKCKPCVQTHSCRASSKVKGAVQLLAEQPAAAAAAAVHGQMLVVGNVTTSRTAEDPANVTPDASASCSFVTVDSAADDCVSKTMSKSTTTLPAAMPTMSISEGKHPATVAVSVLKLVSNCTRSGLPVDPMSSMLIDVRVIFARTEFEESVSSSASCI